MTTHRRTLLLAAAALPFAWQASAQQSTITIGYQLPLTREYSQYGECLRNSAIMALEAFNRSGRIPAQVNIIFAETRSDPREAVAGARKFVNNRDIVAVLGDFSSSASIQAGRVNAEAGMPELSHTASHPDFVKVTPGSSATPTPRAMRGRTCHGG